MQLQTCGLWKVLCVNFKFRMMFLDKSSVSAHNLDTRSTSALLLDMTRVNLTLIVNKTIRRHRPTFFVWTKTRVWSVINKKQCCYRTDVQLHEEKASMEHVQFPHSSSGRSISIQTPLCNLLRSPDCNTEAVFASMLVSFW